VHPAEEMLSRPGGLAERLFGMRKAAGLGVGELAERLGWPTPKVSKIQHGRQKPSVDEVSDWAEACGHPEATAELLDLLAEVETVSWRWDKRMSRGLASIQEEIAVQERKARYIRSIQTDIMPGQLQTAEYARHMITMFCKMQRKGFEDIEEAVAGRMRRQETLYDPGRTFEFVIRETVLREQVGSPQVMLRQMDWLTNFTALDNITLGIFAEGVPHEYIPYQSFRMLDEMVVVETYEGEKRDRKDPADWSRAADLYLAESAVGEDALRLIAKAAAYWRGKATKTGEGEE